MPIYEAHRTLPYTAPQLFELAADVERYPEFLPWWIAARVRRREGDVYHTDQIIGFSVFRARFSSMTTLRPPDRIEVTSTDGPFRHFRLVWSFDPEPKPLCRVVLAVDLAFRSRLIGMTFDAALATQLDRLIEAFERRAGYLYGRGRADGDRPLE